MASRPKAADVPETEIPQIDQKSLVVIPSAKDPQWQENPYAAEESIATSEAEGRVLNLLIKDLSEASARFTKEMSKKDDWWSDVESIFHQKRNSDYFEPCVEEWLECVKDAITKRFPDLLQLRSRSAGLDPSKAVHEAAEIVIRVAHKQCWLNDAFRSMSCLDRLPAGVPDRSASYEPVGSYLLRCMDSVCSQVERLREEELARIDLLPAVIGQKVPPAPAAQPQEKEEVTLRPNRYLALAKSKMKDKVNFPFMDAHEISPVLGVSEKRVYELPGLVPYPTPLARKRLFTTESVIALYESLRSDEP